MITFNDQCRKQSSENKVCRFLDKNKPSMTDVANSLLQKKMYRLSDEKRSMNDVGHSLVKNIHRLEAVNDEGNSLMQSFMNKFVLSSSNEHEVYCKVMYCS